MRKNMYVMSMVGILSCINASLYAAHAGHGVVVNHKLQRRWSESDIGKAAAPNNNRVLNANLVALQARPHQFSQKNNNVIDVNTGRFTGKKNLEDTILKTNLEAAQEVVRQLRLRNIGGLIVIDFIDMATGTNRNKLFNALGKTLKEKDKFQSVVLKVSEFGLVEMTRKRSGKTLVQQLMHTCATCSGLGFVKSTQTECYEIFHDLKITLLKDKPSPKILLHVNPVMFDYITSTEYDPILQLEKTHSCKIEMVRQNNFTTGQYKIEKT